jgi:hypothetical protein
MAGDEAMRPVVVPDAFGANPEATRLLSPDSPKSLSSLHKHRAFPKFVYLTEASISPIPAAA